MSLVIVSEGEDERIEEEGGGGGDCTSAGLCGNRPIVGPGRR